MKATRLLGIGHIATIDLPTPDPAPGEVLVKVAAAGICGTDRHLLRGEFPSKPPVTLGHEFSGIVVALGAGVTTIAMGARVTCDPNIACGTCDQCLGGRINLCRNLSAVGVTRDGGFADYAAFPAHRALVLPDHMDLIHGAFCEPLACCIHGIDIGAPRPGEKVLVIGGGVIGMLALQLARNAGAQTMLMTRQAEKRVLATSLGAGLTAANAAEARTLWPGGADLVVECAGVVDTVEMCPGLTRSGGRIVVLGVLSAGQKVQIEPFDLLFREVQMLFSFVNPFTQARAVQMIADGSVSVAPLISRRLTLDQAPGAIANPPPPGEIRALVLPAGLN